MNEQLSSLPAPDSFTRYIEEIKRYPHLRLEEETELARRYREEGDEEAGHVLVRAHLRYVVKIAAGFRGYGLPLADLVSEGNSGLLQALGRFEPGKGFRFSTYAQWWIRASINEYVLRSWSLVKIGTTANQKKLFFNLRRAKQNLQALDDGDLRPDQVTAIAEKLCVSEDEVIEMNRRLSGDASLNVGLEDGGGEERQDFLVDAEPNPEERLIAEETRANRLAALRSAMQVLTAREQRIVDARKLADDALTLETLAQELGVSRERVRQIEARALQKLQVAVAENLAVIERRGRKSPSVVYAGAYAEHASVS